MLPAYIRNTAKGEDEDEALNNALVWVNNVSKKKLLGSLMQIRSVLFAMETVPKTHTENCSNPLLEQLEDNMKETLGRISDYSGICQPEDIIRMCNIPSPKMTEEDLVTEKKILLL